MINDDVKYLLEYHGFPTHKLDDAISLHFEGKQKMLDILGLNEGNNWRVPVQLPEVAESKESVAYFLREIEECVGRYRVIEKNSEYMLDDKARVRVGKIFPLYIKDYYFGALRLISEYYKKVKKQELKDCDNFLKENLVYTYALLKEAKIAFADEDIWDDKKIDNIIARFSCFYGDFIKSKRAGYISGNPLDYFTLSRVGTTFTSCIGIGGEYFNSAVHYLCNPNTFISYTTDDYGDLKDSTKAIKDVPKEIIGSIHKKIGRSMFYLNEGLIIASKYYGSYYEPENLAFIEFLKERMGGGFKQSSLTVKDSLMINHNTGAYIDFGSTKAFVRAKYEKIDFNSGMCLKCGGKIAEFPNKGMCKPCAEGKVMCGVCGKRHGRYRSLQHNMTICETCIKEWVSCHCCGDFVKKEDITQVMRSDLRVSKYCGNCEIEYTKTCSCGEVFRPEREEKVCFVCGEKAKKEKEAAEKKELKKALKAVKVDLPPLEYKEEEEEG